MTHLLSPRLPTQADSSKTELVTIQIHNGTIYSAQWLTTEPARINNGNMYSSQELTSELKEIHIRRSAEGDPQKYEYMYRRECQNVSLAERTVIHSVVCTEGEWLKW